jgi:hypothetical protein
MVLAMLLGGTAAWADFYVIAGGGAPGTRIPSVPYTISSPGFYFLGGNLTMTGNGVAIIINADDVTLDLMGFCLIGPGAGNFNGIYMNGRTNVEIRHGTVRGFSTGIEAFSDTSSNHRVINIKAMYNKGWGILLRGDNHLVQDCNSSNNMTGISVYSGIVKGCMAYNNSQTGIGLEISGSLIGNFALNNTVHNFILGTGKILVDQNSASNNYVSTEFKNYFLIGGGVVTWGVNAGYP